MNRSKRGGFWFERKPFQTGDYATLPEPKPEWRDGGLPDPEIFGPTCDPCAPFHHVTYTGGTWKFWRHYPAQSRVKVATFFLTTVGVPTWFEDLGRGKSNSASASLGTCSFPFLMFPSAHPQKIEDYWYIKEPPPVPNYIATLVYIGVPFWWTKDIEASDRIELDVFGHH